MTYLLSAAVLLAALPAQAQQDAHMHRQHDTRAAIVASAAASPFDPAAATREFTSLPDGGVQRAFARDRRDLHQVTMVREHLQGMAHQFRNGDFSGPAQDGDRMAGLEQLRQAKPGQLEVEYRDVIGGAELQFRSKDQQLVEAVHQWFDALAGQGREADEGHQQHRHPVTE